jgi:hypothetical protein
MLISDEVRRDLGLPSDCGVFDPVKNVWYISDDVWQRYTPDIPRQCEDDPSEMWADE